MIEYKDMKFIYCPNFELSYSLIKKLTDISSKESQLKLLPLATANKIEISYLANIDAVHFSTKLEGNLLTYDQVTDALIGNTKNITSKRDLREVINYSKARKMLFDKANRGAELNKALLLGTHQELMTEIVAGKLKGHYRQAQNVIRQLNSKEIVYLPPEASDVDELMEGLFDWTKKSILEEVPVYVVAAIFHYYFVTIHPFMDGNGRTARLLTNYILLRNGITVPEYATLEKQHENYRDEYYNQLRQLQAPTFYDISDTIDITPWINYWLDCLLKTYDEALERCESHPQHEIVLDYRLQKAVSLFKKHQILKASDYQALMGLGRTQAIEDLNRLIENKLISRIGKGRSQTYRSVS
jgi:Fic family protein